MVFVIIHIIFVPIGALIGYFLFPFTDKLIGAAVGGGAALLIIGLELSLRKISGKALVSGSIGSILGLLVAFLLSQSFEEFDDRWIRPVLSLFFGYLGLTVGLRKKDSLSLGPLLGVRKMKGEGDLKILDTSVIIDGRIADICETGFIGGTLIVPRFVLRELQSIADSSDPLKRKRGRRGLDILNKIQKNINVDVIIQESDYPEIREVDGKLVKLGKVMGARILTNDYNLNKVAELQEVRVLNINELANALKPVVLPGEEMRVRLVKEGKELNQGVAYLDDGTMIVVDDGKRFIGQHMDVVVTSVLQTTAGRMIFARLKEGA